MHPPLALTHPHIQHVFNAHHDESRLTLPRSRPRDVSFAATRRPIKQNPSADFFAVSLVNFRVLKRINNIETNLLFEIVHAADAAKSYGRAL